MRRALPLAAMLAACSLREPRVTAASCSRSSQCSSSRVCFLGECRPPAANLSLVRAEVRPASGSPFGVRKLQVDLRLSVLNDFSLVPPSPTSGTVTQDGNGVDGGTVVFTEHTPAVIPDRLEQVVAVIDRSGAYQAQLAQGTWDVLVTPPGPLPPLRAGPIDAALSPSLDLALPGAASLVSFDGGLAVSGDGGPIAGASVTAVDPQGVPLSAPSLSDSDGGYSLLLPTGLGSPVLQIGPAAADGGNPQPAAADPFPTYAPQPYAPVLALPLPPGSPLAVRIVNSAGDLVPSSAIYVRSADPAWTLARSVVSDTGLATIALREGNYFVQAAAPADATSPGVSPSRPITLPLGTTLELTCPAKLSRLGTILAPDGKAVGVNFQIIATRISDDLIPTRTITATTDPKGTFRFVADAGTWRFEVVPPPDLHLPRTIVSITLDPTDPQDSSLEPIRIARPLPVGGVVTGRVSPGGASTLVANAMVSFFALDSSSRSIYLGGGRTDAAGHYDVVLPDVGEPAVSP